MTLLVNIIGLTLLGLIAWWFWFSKSKKHFVKGKKVTVIKVKDGVYQPANIEVPLGEPITLRFIREDASPCSEYVIFNQLNINKLLPLKTPVDIKVELKQPGEYEFTCQMGMYRGKLITR